MFEFIIGLTVCCICSACTDHSNLIESEFDHIIHPSPSRAQKGKLWKRGERNKKSAFVGDGCIIRLVSRKTGWNQAVFRSNSFHVVSTENMFQPNSGNGTKDAVSHVCREGGGLSEQSRRGILWIFTGLSVRTCQRKSIYNRENEVETCWDHGTGYPILGQALENRPGPTCSNHLNPSAIAMKAIHI